MEPFCLLEFCDAINAKKTVIVAPFEDMDVLSNISNMLMTKKLENARFLAKFSRSWPLGTVKLAEIVQSLCVV